MGRGLDAVYKILGLGVHEVGKFPKGIDSLVCITFLLTSFLQIFPGGYLTPLCASMLSPDKRLI